MLSVLKNRTYRHLFLAQVLALLGTGLATVALGLLAWDLAGDAAGQVLGTALSIKMLAYVFLAPVAAAVAERLPRRTVLITLDLIRGAIALALPFVTQIWQVYLLIFLLQAASAGFTPVFQATIPRILVAEKDYVKALSLSRMAYDLESLISPVLAAALLTIVSFQSLFLGTVAGFVASALLVTRVGLPARDVVPKGGIWERTTGGIRLFASSPRLRGLMGVNLAVAAGGSMVIVNTVVLVKAQYGLGEASVALALGAFGAGSMLVALILPRVLDRLDDRRVLFSGAIMLGIGVALGPAVQGFGGLIALWAFLGAGFSLAQTPIGRVLRHSATSSDHPSVFAAQFALSHACWLLTYPIAGWLGLYAGMAPTFWALAGLAVIGVTWAHLMWPRQLEDPVRHSHKDLPADHPHLTEYGGRTHAHPVFGDDLHQALMMGTRAER